MKLTGNTIVVTGGTSGIGRDLVERFIGMGNSVVTCGRRKDRLDEMQSRLPGLSVFSCDVADEAQRAAFVEWIGARHPAVNVLVNNAGIQLVTDLKRPWTSAGSAAKWRPTSWRRCTSPRFLPR